MHHTIGSNCRSRTFQALAWLPLQGLEDKEGEEVLEEETDEEEEMDDEQEEEKKRMRRR